MTKPGVMRSSQATREETDATRRGASKRIGRLFLLCRRLTGEGVRVIFDFLAPSSGPTLPDGFEEFAGARLTSPHPRSIDQNRLFNRPRHQVPALLNYRATGMGPLFARWKVGGRLAGNEVESPLGHRDLR
jgi:hypothetical protein